MITKKMKLIANGLCLFLIYSQESISITIPQGIVLPWQFTGITAEIKTIAKKGLNQKLDELSSDILDNKTNLNTFLEKDNSKLKLTKQQIYRFNNIFAGNLKEPASQPIIYTPSLCRVGEHIMVSLTAKSLNNHRVLAISNKITQRKEWQKGLANHQIITNEEIKRLTAGLSISTKATEIENNDNLRINVISKINNSSTSAVENSCLNKLVHRKLLELGFSTFENKSGELSILMKKIFLKTPKQLRPTRHISLLWTFANKSKKSTSLWPLSAKVDVKIIDAIFARSGESFRDITWKMNVKKDKQVTLSWNSSLTTHLKKDQSSLANDSLPTVIKVLGAWAFLDKGRAWGLRYGDRLVNTSGSEAIKGHVVDFYGPEKKLRSKNGSLIYEGAILYIRKGQKKIQKSTSFAYDTTKYPTPMPNIK